MYEVEVEMGSDFLLVRYRDIDCIIYPKYTHYAALQMRTESSLEHRCIHSGKVASRTLQTLVQARKHNTLSKTKGQMRGQELT